LLSLLLIITPPPTSTLFPYTTLFRSEFEPVRYDGASVPFDFMNKLKPYVRFIPVCPEIAIGLGVPRDPIRVVLKNGRKKLIQPSDRKSTRLNSSHVAISYAVFCLKKN